MILLFEHSKHQGLNKNMESKLLKARKAKGFTQAYVAEQVGCTQTNISHIEIGRQRATPEIAQKLAELLGLSPMDILYPGNQAE